MFYNEEQEVEFLLKITMKPWSFPGPEAPHPGPPVLRFHIPFQGVSYLTHWLGVKGTAMYWMTCSFLGVISFWIHELMILSSMTFWFLRTFWLLPLWWVLFWVRFSSFLIILYRLTLRLVELDHREHYLRFAWTIFSS